MWCLIKDHFSWARICVMRRRMAASVNQTRMRECWGVAYLYRIKMSQSGTTWTPHSWEWWHSTTNELAQTSQNEHEETWHIDDNIFLNLMCLANKLFLTLEFSGHRMAKKSLKVRNSISKDRKTYSSASHLCWCVSIRSFGISNPYVKVWILYHVTFDGTRSLQKVELCCVVWSQSPYVWAFKKTTAWIFRKRDRRVKVNWHKGRILKTSNCPISHSPVRQEWAYSILPVVMCCSVLQCVAVCCSVLQCVAVCCSVLQCIAVCQLPNLTQHRSSKIGIRIVAWCSALQCVAVCCSILQNNILIVVCVFESCHVRIRRVKYEWVTSRMDESRHVGMATSHLIHMNDLLHTYESVNSHIGMSLRPFTIESCHVLQQGVGGIFFPDTDAKTSRRSPNHPPPPPLPFTLKRQDFEILAPKIKISAPKFKYLVPKCGVKFKYHRQNSN